MCNDKKCKCIKTCEDRYKAKYECYLEKEKILEEAMKKCEDSMPDNSHGINPEVYNQSRDRVYLLYTGKDRIKW